MTPRPPLFIVAALGAEVRLLGRCQSVRRPRAEREALPYQEQYQPAIVRVMTEQEARDLAATVRSAASVDQSI